MGWLQASHSLERGEQCAEERGAAGRAAWGGQDADQTKGQRDVYGGLGWCGRGWKKRTQNLPGRCKKCRMEGLSSRNDRTSKVAGSGGWK